MTLLFNSFYKNFCLINFLIDRTIVEWVNKDERYTHPGLGLYQRKNMEEVIFSDLSIRLNQPYLFVHKGDCEHAIVFTDLRYVFCTTIAVKLYLQADLP
jgi:snRNA-activating protein complex subunit 3